MFAVIPPKALGNTNSVKILQLDSGMSVCPKGLCKYHSNCLQSNCYLDIVHLSMDSSAKTAKEDLEKVVSSLFSFNTEIETGQRPEVLYFAYFNQPVRQPVVSSQIPANIFITSDPTSDVDSASHVEEAKSIFEKICPNENFLPMAPGPDDLVWDEQQE